jgi:hypothetical protein
LPTKLLAWVKNDKFLLVTRQELRQKKLRGLMESFLLRFFKMPVILIFPVTKGEGSQSLALLHGCGAIEIID